jgi:guanine deaminase
MGVVADSAAADAERYMRFALQMAERGMAAGGPPVGACLVSDGEVLVAAHNCVVGEMDITAHAEITVIRQACRDLNALSLAGSILYVTVEPCAMCLAASHYAGISEIVFGAPIGAMHAITQDELRVDANELLGDTASLRVTGGVLVAECQALLDQWRPAGGTG